MKEKVKLTPASNLNLVLSVTKDGIVISSNEASEPILKEWGVEAGQKLPSRIVDLVQMVISRNSPEKIDVNVGNRVYLVVFHPVPEQECVHISGFDINEHKNFENKLLEDKEKYHRLFEYSIDGIIFTDPREGGKILSANPAFCQMIGWKEEELVGKGRDVMFDIRDPEISNHLEECASFGFAKAQLTYRRKNGTTFDGEVHTALINDNNGEPRVIAIVRDISERKHAEEALKKAHEILEEKVKERTAELEKAYNLLRESEKGFAEAQRMAHIGNWVWDIATNKAYWSNELYRIFGRDPQKLAPSIDEFHSYIHPDDRQDYVNLAYKALNEKSSLGADFRIILDDGEERRVYIQSKIILNETNDPIQLWGIVQDITESKKSEEKIRNLANIVESSSDAIGTLSLDGIFMSWNKGAEQLYDYSVEEILGQHISLLAPSHLKNETQKYVELIKQTSMSYRYTTSRLRKDGEIIEVSITLSPVFDSIGKLTTISFIVRDITERKRSEEKLRQSEEKYRNIVETANEGIALLDSEGIISYLNIKMSDMLGYSSEEMIGRPTWNFVATEFIPINKSQIEKRHLSVSESYEIKLIRKDGSPIWVAINAKSMFDDNGNYIGSLSMHTDITKRKEAEETLNKIDIVRKQEIHHRIKNNLQVISSLLDLQADKIKNRKCIKDCQIECFRNLEVIDAFKVSQDRVISMALIHEELHKGGQIDTLNVSHYIEHLTDNLLLTYKVGNNGIVLDTDIEEDIFFDIDTAVPLGIIINELVSNCIKHAFSGRGKGEIRIKLQREYGEGKTENDLSTTFILSVSDNGIGIPADLDIKDLDSLGLQLVITLVDQLVGELELKKDNGTEFIIMFAVQDNNNLPSESASQLV